ncbi:hypothetical protein BX616_001039 [Lobosporangium transversale]|uniref:Chitin-binding type-4 domain-containing protein n=1 Tax=Lobosporangium transversale TaxID=64571 RepID=A0A1Y2GTW4_9FUNG|nr:hypothetical protein BCR41DRAFT_420662 [Lobosporangium transversale]KAF9905315.1 hypothetical protein BX616_001039 [Lobosporangium transversale]ORZ22921.1 hypothetical protein BCR41DRAFT_420662 [Lobosporangium transversale]|eukprot:XP_021883475.1 hypothetical protein BCR41DRAFT_420662 [Lobosporangium transversale]
MKLLASAALLALSSMALVADAHISFRYPCPRKAPYSECPKPNDNQWGEVDYDVQSPVGTYNHISDPICKHSSSFAGVRPTFQAGSTIPAKMDVDVNHRGGSCQWALSYDNGKTWVVIQDHFQDCLANAPAGSTFSLPVRIPANAPSGPAVLNWLWNNNEGNRELYSSCADIVIQGTNGGSLSGVAPLFANYGAGSPYIPERAVSGGNWGKQYFDARKPITVTVPPRQLKRQVVPLN